VLDAGVVDQHVGGQVEAVEAGRVGQVGGHRGAAELARDPLGALAVQVDHGHLGPGGGQPAGAGLADPAGRPGDQGRPAVKLHVHPRPPSQSVRLHTFTRIPAGEPVQRQRRLRDDVEPPHIRAALNFLPWARDHPG
jgi:hypothetical protein